MTMNAFAQDIRKVALYPGAITTRNKIDTTRARYMPLKPFFEQQLKDRKSLKEITDELNARGVSTAHAKMWHRTSVSRVLKVLGLTAVGRWG
jgi:hypothetical protein